VSAAAAADGGQKLARIARERAQAAKGRFSAKPNNEDDRQVARSFDFCYTPPMDDRHPDKKRARQERRLDEGLKETFPASDPVSVASIDKPEPDASDPPPKP